MTTKHSDATFLTVTYSATSAADVAILAAYKVTLPATHVAHTFADAKTLQLYKSQVPAFLAFLEAPVA